MWYILYVYTHLYLYPVLISQDLPDLSSPLPHHEKFIFLLSVHIFHYPLLAPTPKFYINKSLKVKD